MKENKNHSFDLPRLANRETVSRLSISIYNEGKVVFLLDIATGSDDNDDASGGVVRVFDTFRRTILEEDFMDYACIGNEIVVFKLTNVCCFFVLPTKIVLIKLDESGKMADFAIKDEKVYIKCGIKWKQCNEIVLFLHDEELSKSTQMTIAEQLIIHK